MTSRSAFTCNNPALAFAVTLCHLYGLDEAAEREVQHLKKNLLGLLAVREFAPEVGQRAMGVGGKDGWGSCLGLISLHAFAQAQFENPTQSFVLTDVICPYCNLCRDLDLCRDSRLVSGDWQCPQCDQPSVFMRYSVNLYFTRYDKELIENSLVAIVQEMAASYQLQVGLLWRFCPEGIFYYPPRI